MKNTLAAFVLSLLFVTSGAEAYSPPAGFILGKVLKEHEKIKTLDLDGRISSPTSGGVIKETLRIDFPNSKVIAIYTTESGEALGARVTKIQDLQPMGRAWIGVGMDPFGNRVRATLEDLGVYPQETTDVKIDRVGVNPVWFWGQQNKLKILKDEFLFAGYQADGADIEVLAFTAKNGGVRLPKTVLVKKGNFTYELKGFRLNAAVSKNAPSLSPIHSEPVREWVGLVR